MVRRRVLSLLSVSFAMAGCMSAPTATPPRSRDASLASRPAAEPVMHRYEVRCSETAADLFIEATFPAGVSQELSVDHDAEAFVREVEVARDGGFVPVSANGTSWFVPSCEERGCTVRYRYELAAAAASSGDENLASDRGGALLSPPSTWLLRPLGGPPGRFRFRVVTPPGVRFVTGVFPASDGETGVYEADLSDLKETPYSGFGPLRVTSLDVPSGTIQVAIAPGDFDGGDALVTAWIARAARVVSAYYGRFPLRHALVLVVPTNGERIGFSRTLGNGGGAIVAPVGRRIDAAALDRDWVMTHEMIHLGFPNLAREHSWLEEGIATYIEPLARARLGDLSANDVWRGLARGLPNGLPREGDRGLDRTPTWGRRYWGGALFCLLADLEIRGRTDNARSLDDALRAILDAGGDVSVRWDIEQALAVGDRATGLDVLTSLYERMANAAVDVDLDALFMRLGVTRSGRDVRFDDLAPLAAIRRSMTEKALASLSVEGSRVTAAEAFDFFAQGARGGERVHPFEDAAEALRVVSGGVDPAQIR